VRDWAPMFSRSFHLWAYKNDGMTPPGKGFSITSRKPTLYTSTGWWFGTFFVFPYIGNNHPN